MEAAGRRAWAVLGIAGCVVVLGYLAGRLSLVVVPVILALFPASLLAPVATWLKERRVPAALASIGTIVGGLLLVGAVLGSTVPFVIAQLPELASSLSEGIGQLDELVGRAPLGDDVRRVDDLVAMAQEQLGEAGEVAGQALRAAVVAFETVAGAVLLVVALFFYLKDGRRLADGVVSTLPAPLRGRAGVIAERSWGTLGRYFRGQLLVALVDAILIGLGLVVVGIPLAVPLAVLIFFGGLFPIVGAVTTGTLAVVVALADAGLATAIVVLVIVLVVQQVESNVLEPLILGRAINLHPFVVLLSVTAGGVLFGILGAFLAVPVAAVTSDVADVLLEPPAAA